MLQRRHPGHRYVTMKRVGIVCLFVCLFRCVQPLCPLVQTFTHRSADLDTTILLNPSNCLSILMCFYVSASSAVLVYVTAVAAVPTGTYNHTPVIPLSFPNSRMCDACGSHCCCPCSWLPDQGWAIPVRGKLSTHQ